MSLSQPRRPPDDDDDEPKIEREWRFRPRRLLIGVALIAIGVIWSFLAGGSPGKSGDTTPVVHQAVETHVLALDGVKARPRLLPAVKADTPVVAQISFRDDGSAARLITPGAIRLVVAGKSLPPTGGAQALHPTLLQPGSYVSGTLYFSHNPAPGAVLVFAPSWAHGHTLRWLLWS